MTVMLRKKKRKIWLSIPCYSGRPTLGTVKSLIHDMFRIVMRGDEVFIDDTIGHADIYLCRAQRVANFLADKDATDLVFIDDDVQWEPNGLQMLLNHDVDLVAAAYPKREEPLQFMFRSALDHGGALKGDAGTGLVEVEGMPGGFMRMRRGMLERMWDHYKPTLGQTDKKMPQGECVRLFDPYWMDTNLGRMVLSEDYAFCQRWRDIGGTVYMDVSIATGHVGTKVYAGRLGDFVEATETEEAA